jgi:tetratricopeptide (TPR) repeat protein
MTRARLVAALALWAFPALAAVPPVPIPPHADTVSTSVPPAPLLVPGRPNPVDTLPSTSPRTAQEQYALGRELERTGHPAAAITEYRKAVRMDPTIPDAHYRMGRLFSAVSQHKPAAQEYTAELRIQPGHRLASRWLGLELAQLGDTASAVALLRTLVQRHPDDEPSWQALGFALATAGRPEEGERALRRALTLDPADGDAWRDLGTVRAAQHDTAGARQAYAHAVKLMPHDAGIYVNMGNLERRASNLEAALADYREAVARDSSQALAWRGQVSVLIDMGRAAEAGQVYRRWLAHDPTDAPLRVQAMDYFTGAGRRDIALELGREGVRIAPKSAEAHLALGMALHESGNARASLAELRRAESLFIRHEASARVGALIRSLRRGAPDSLRAMFAEDSLQYEASRPMVPADSSYTPVVR